MSKSVKVEDIAHKEMSEYSNETGVPIIKLISFGWSYYSREILKLEVEKEE